MAEDILQEEAISLKPIEKITAMVGEDVQKEEITEIKNYQLTRENLPVFRVMIRKELSNQLQHLGYIMYRIINKFRLYPDFNTYFTGQMQPDGKPLQRPMQLMTNLTSWELKRNGNEIMMELREFVPTLMLAIEVAVQGLEKTWEMTASPIKTIIVGAPDGRMNNTIYRAMEWGQAKTDKAWLMSQNGKSRVEIAAELPCELNEVSAFILHGLKRAAKFGIVKPLEESTIPESKKEKVEAEKPLEIKI